MTEIIPETPAGFFALLLAGAGALFGLLVVWLTDQLIALWEARTHAPISPTKQRWLSLAVPAGLVFIGYAGSVLLGTVPLTGQTVYQAGIAALAATGVKQAAYAALESRAKPQVVTNIGTQTNIEHVDAADDVLLGSTQTEAPPARDPRQGGTGGGLV
jgi:hypothetical protein